MRNIECPYFFLIIDQDFILKWIDQLIVVLIIIKSFIITELFPIMSQNFGRTSYLKTQIFNIKIIENLEKYANLRKFYFFFQNHVTFLW